MTTQTQVTPLAVEDYEAIEAAVMETTRGRWFLAEYARRNRNTDTDVVLTALDRVERTLRRDRAAPDIDRIRLDLADMAEAISRTKQEIAQMKLETEHGGRFADASHELDAIVSQTETATNEILLAAEGIQEAAWTLREAGAADELCGKLDDHATEIYTACSFQDLTGQRTRKVVTVLRYLESRIHAMMSIWGIDAAEDVEEVAAGAEPHHPGDARPDAHLLNGPQLHGRGIEQSAVDDLMWDQETPDEVGPQQGEEPAVLAADTTSAEPDVFDAEEPALAPPLGLDPEIDLSAADVFSSADTDRIGAHVRARNNAAEDDDLFADDDPAIAPAATTVVVGNTVRTVAIEAEAMADREPAPALEVVQAEDPIGELSARQRIIAFG